MLLIEHFSMKADKLLHIVMLNSEIIAKSGYMKPRNDAFLCLETLGNVNDAVQLR